MRGHSRGRHSVLSITVEPILNIRAGTGASFCLRCWETLPGSAILQLIQEALLRRVPLPWDDLPIAPLWPPTPRTDMVVELATLGEEGAAAQTLEAVIGVLQVRHERQLARERATAGLAAQITHRRRSCSRASTRTNEGHCA